MQIEIHQSTLRAWAECREKYRLGELLQVKEISPNIHYWFGSVCHKIAECYWNGKTFMEAFQAGLEMSTQLDQRLLTAANRKKWVDLCEYISPITGIYFKHHGSRCHEEPLVYNEHTFRWPWGTHAGIEIICVGTIDRLSQDGILSDTKTAAAIGFNWKSDLKKRLLREPQLPFYGLYAADQGHHITGMEYEIIVKPYRGSDPFIEHIDVSKEIRLMLPIWKQQFDWQIREIAEFHAHCADAKPWPQSTSACTSMIWGDCEYLPVCLGQSSVEDSTLYSITKGMEL